MNMVELTKENFDHEVTEVPGRVVVDFWSPGCGPCRMLEPILDQVSAAHPDVRFAKVNASALPDVTWAFEVMSTPTIVLFEDGVPKDRIEGLVPASRIEQMLKG